MSLSFERRHSSRFDVDPLVCRGFPEPQGLCVLRNVSLSGAFFLSHVLPPIGTVVRLEFAEMPLEGYQLNCRVVRHDVGDAKGFAVSFRNLRPKILRAVYHPIAPL